MKKQIFLFVITILSFNCYSQISFEKGYYINNSNQKITCLIKNIDWKNNPTEFKYRLSENGEIQNATIQNVKEFGFFNTSKYIRQTVDIDKSSDLLKNLSKEKTPVFEEEELFLKILVEGKANLYEYSESNMLRYFYKTENSEIKQLVHKSYRIQDYILKNNQFRQQLWNDLKCPNMKIRRVENIDYKKNDLIKFFTNYSKCNDDDLNFVEQKEKRNLLNLTIRPRLISSSLVVENTIRDANSDFGNKIGFGLGLEAEYILPFNKNKWSIFAEPTYQTFKGEENVEISNVSGGMLETKVDYKSIEVPVGIRNYFF